MSWIRGHQPVLVTVTGFGLMVVGGCLASSILRFHNLTLSEVGAYVDHGQASDPGHIGDRVATLITDVRYFWAYGLVLVGFAVLFHARSFSRFSRRLAVLAVLAAILAPVGHWLEHGISQRSSSADTWLNVAGALHATRWCALFVALVAVPAVVGIVLRGVWGALRGAVWRWRAVHPERRLSSPAEPTPSAPISGVARSGDPQPPTTVRDAALHSDERAAADGREGARRQWFADVVEKPEYPEGSDIDGPEANWVTAFNVPGATAVISRRDGQNLPVQALCLSGGGVRSACVAMGAMQVLARTPRIEAVAPGSVQTFVVEGEEPPPAPRLLDSVDYIISVSGGGYSAGARLLAVQPKPDPPKGLRRTIGKAIGWARQILRREQTPLNRNEPEVWLSDRFQDGSAEFEHLRRHSSYISDSPAGLVRALLMILKNLVASLIMIMTVPVIAGWVTGWLLALTAIAAFSPVPKDYVAGGERLRALADHPGAYWAVGAFTLLSFIFVFFALLTEWGWWGSFSDRFRAAFNALAQASLAFAAIIGIITIAIPALMLWFWTIWQHHHGDGAQAAATGISGVVGLNFVAAIVAILWGNKSKASANAATKDISLIKRALPPALVRTILVIVTLGVLIAVWIALFGSFALGVFQYLTEHGDATRLTAIPNWKWWLGGMLATLALLGFADVTTLSLHPFYRRRLASTFAVRRDLTGPGAIAYPASEHTWLHTYGTAHSADTSCPPVSRPTFVFAAAATISGANKPAPGLNAVSYVLSADHVGGPHLGWLKTKQLWQASPPRIKRDLTVQAAVAISGAAIASAMGRMDPGFEKVLAVTGARLGTWLPNPHYVESLANVHESMPAQPTSPISTRRWPASLPTVRGAGYLYREILGINNKDARLVQVTDGGHYDNSGLVEALRRRSRLIICIDGGGDTPPLSTGLADAIRLAKFELGVTVTMRTAEADSIAGLAPGSGDAPADRALAGLKGRITKRTVAVADIEYPSAAGLAPNRRGTLVYAKAVLPENSPAWLLTYAASKEGQIFPHDPTTDQWFTEGRFAAYTELGRIIGREIQERLSAIRSEENSPSNLATVTADAAQRSSVPRAVTSCGPTR